MAKPVGRTKFNGTGRQERKFTRQAYTYKFKRAAIDHFERTKNIQSTIDRFFPEGSENSKNSKSKLIYKWSKQRALIEFTAANSRLAAHRRVLNVGLGTTMPFEAETLLVKWVNDYRRDGVPISALILQLKAQEIVRGYGISKTPFSVTWQWQRNFTNRHRLSFRAKTHQGQITPRDATERALAFSKAVAARVTAEGIKVIYNADQTGIFFELLPRTTLSLTDAKTVWVKCGKKEKERMIAMLLGNSTLRKYPPFLVMKTAPSKKKAMRAENASLRHGFGKRMWDQVYQLQEQQNVRIYRNQSAWWTGVLTIEFLRFHFGHCNVFSDPIILLLDDISGHWIPEIETNAASLRVVIMKVPAGLTWLCQPTDAVWIKPAKDRLRRY